MTGVKRPSCSCWSWLETARFLLVCRPVCMERSCNGGIAVLSSSGETYRGTISMSRSSPSSESLLRLGERESAASESMAVVFSAPS